MSNYSPLLDVLIKIKDYGGFVNSHSHLDRANTITPESMQRVNDHLFEKWKFVEKVKSESSEKDYEKRIAAAMESQKKMGVTKICTFIDIDSVAGLRALRAADKVKTNISGIDLRIACQTLEGVLGPIPKKLIEEGLSLGMIDIIGSLPGADRGRVKEHLDVIMGWAKDTGKMVHAHVDQLNTSIEVETEILARKTIEHGLEGKVVAIHGISLACHQKEYRERVYGLCKDAGITFISCPSAWIDHKRSEVMSPTHSAITPVDELLQYDIPVALGTDNIHDVYKPFCDGSMVNEMRLLVDACRVYDANDIIRICTTNGYKALGF